MYSSSQDGRTVIKIGGKPLTGDRTTPLCSVPIKTTATFNIQLTNLIQTGKLDTGSNSRNGDAAAFGRTSSTSTSEAWTSCDEDLQRRRGNPSENDLEELGGKGGGVGGRTGNGRSDSSCTTGTDDVIDGFGFRDRRGSNSSTVSGDESPTDQQQYSALSKCTNTSTSTGISGSGTGAVDFWATGSGVSSGGAASVMSSADSAVGTSCLDDNKSSYSSGENDQDEENPTSSFNFIGWDVGSDKPQPPMSCRRVLMWKDSEMALMFKASCKTEDVGRNPKFLALMGDIAENCVKRLKKMKDMTLSNLHAEHLDTLPLSDGRLTKQHIDELSASVGDTVTITEIAFRFQPPEGTYLGTFVQGTVLEKRSYAIGRIGVMVVLLKKSKYATVEAFSEQLCQHIAITKPSTLGTIKLAKNASLAAELEHLQRDQLLLQRFTPDPTIIVAEAARRSFVKIEDFLIFK